jgi:drug/metabolite transporter (DMT)-like permease
MIYYLYVPLALTSSVFFLDEELTSEKLIGSAMVIGASVALSLYRFKRGQF